MKIANFSPSRSHRSIQDVISNTRSYNNEADVLSLKHTAKGSFPSLSLEYKGYKLGPEYIMARRMKEYLYYPGRTADVDGIIPDYLNNEFEKLYTTMRRLSPMQSPPQEPLPQKRMIDVARTMFDRERVRRSVSARTRSCRDEVTDEYNYNHSEGLARESISLHSSPTRSPAWREASASFSYPDTIPFLSQSYSDPVRDEFLQFVENDQVDQRGASCFRITADRALPCPTTNAAVASLVYLTKHFYHYKNQTRNTNAF